MALCLNCGNDHLERILLFQPTYSPPDLGWTDISTLDTVYEPFFSFYDENNMPRKTTGTTPAGTPRAPVACWRCRKRRIKCSGDKGDGSACSGCRTGNASNQCNFLRVGAVQTLPADFGGFMNPKQQTSQCPTPSSGDIPSMSPINNQHSSVHDKHYEHHRQSQHGLALDGHLNSQSSVCPQQPPFMPSTSYSWSNQAHSPLVTSARNPRSVSYISSHSSSFQSEELRDSFERPTLRPIQQHSFHNVPAERQTLPSLSTTIPYTPLTPTSGSSTSYNNFSANDASHQPRLYTPREFVPAYGQLNASNNSSNSRQQVSYHERSPASPTQLAPLLQHAALTSHDDHFASGLTLPPHDSRYIPAQNHQALSYHYQPLLYHDVKYPSQHQQQQQPQRFQQQYPQDQHSITSPLQTSYINNVIPPTSHQALPGFSTLPSPFHDLYDLYVPAQPRSSGTSMLAQQHGSMRSYSPSGYGGLQPMQVEHLEQPEHILGSSKVGTGRNGSGRRESKKRRSVAG